MAEAEQPERLRGDREVTVDDVRQLVASATPHFAYQIRNRIRKLVAGCPADDPVRLYAEAEIAKMESLGLHRRGPRDARAARHGRAGERERDRAAPLSPGRDGRLTEPLAHATPAGRRARFERAARARAARDVGSPLRGRTQRRADDPASRSCSRARARAHARSAPATRRGPPRRTRTRALAASAPRAPLRRVTGRPPARRDRPPPRLPSLRFMETPDGIPGSVLTGPVSRWGPTRRRCATGCAGSRACRSSARSSGSRRGGRRSGSSCATRPARCRARCGARTSTSCGSGRWPTARRSSSRAAATTTRARAPRRRGSRSRSTRLRVAGEGDLLAQLEQLRRRLHAEGLFEPQKALLAPGAPALHRRRHRRVGQGARRRPGRAAAARLGGADRLGVRARAGPARRAGDPARADRSRLVSGGRGDRRRARRGLAGRPVRVLRRDAVPDGRAAARAGDLLRRPPHGPDAARRRRRRRVLDADARRRDRGPGRLWRGARRAGFERARLERLGRRAVVERARIAARLSRAPAHHVERHRVAPAPGPARAARRVAASGRRRRADERAPTPSRSRAARSRPRRGGLARRAARRSRRRGPGARRPRRRWSAAAATWTASSARSPPTTPSARWSAATRCSRTRRASRSRAPPPPAPCRR